MANLLLINADVMTMDPHCLAAREIAVKHGRILAVGEEDALRKLRTGRHLRALAESLVTLNIGPTTGVRSISDIKEKINCEAQNHPPGTWIRAGGYNEVYLAEKRHPDRKDLDDAAPHHPVKLTHRSGHAHVLNSLGLSLIQISLETPDPPEGIMERDLETGAPTGLFFGLGDFLSKRIPPLKERQLDCGVKLADQELLSCGVTSFQDASSRNDFNRLKQLERWETSGFLKCRASMMLGLKGLEEHLAGRFSIHEAEKALCLDAVKIILDETTGRLNPGQEKLNEIVLAVHEAGFQAVIHAIEEPAIESALTALENALRRFPRPDHRHRIEHCSVCPPDLAGRIASLGVMVVTHPAFLYYSGERYLKTVPSSQLNHLYPLRTLLENGVKVAAGSDAPIVPVNPLAGVYAAVSRKAETGEFVMVKEKITVYKALRMYTELAAASAFEDLDKGIISPGKLADLVVLSANPATVPVEEIKDIQVEMTILDGKVVWTCS